MGLQLLHTLQPLTGVTPPSISPRSVIEEADRGIK